ALVAGALAGDAGGRRAPARLRVAGGVAQVVEQDDGVGGEIERSHVGLAVVLVVVVTGARGRVQPHAVLLRVPRIVGIRAGPAVAVTEVDEHGRADCGGLDLGPRR